MVHFIQYAFEAIDLISKVLGMLALYSIAIALTDWRRTERYKNDK